MANELRYAIRQLIHHPAFSVVAIVMLALGIGANTAIFSVVEGTLLRPLPFPHADRLVRIYEAQDESGQRGGTLNMSEATIRQWQKYGADIFDGIGAATGTNVVLGGSRGESAQNIQAARISASFFSVLGISPAMVRGFSADEDREGGPAAVIISDDFWQHHLNGRPEVVGSTLLLDGVPRTVVGVMPRTFRHPYRALLWVPLALPATANHLNHYLYSPGRLRPGITIAAADAAIRRMCTAINQAEPDPNNARRAYISPLRDSFVLDLRPKILVIVGAACCALLIAAANFAGLLLSRVIEREGEWALRVALGAGRMALVRQQLAQALLLALLGTLAGLLAASWATPVLLALSPEGSDVTGSAMREFDHAARMDWPVFGFAALLMILVGIGFGLLPALRAARVDLRGAINTTARGATLDGNARRLLGSLVVIELAVAAALLMVSITATQYFQKLLREPWGFETSDRLIFNVAHSDSLFPNPAAKQQSINNALLQLRNLPGVKNVTVTVPSPMNAPRDLVSCNPEGASPPEPRGYHLAYLRAAIPGYFPSTGPALLRGRDFLASDAGDSPPVCMVSQAFAKRFWPNQDPLGKRVKWGRLDGPRPWLTVIGVVGDMKAIADPQDGEVVGMLARPLAQLMAAGSYQLDELTFVVHGTGVLPNEPEIRAAFGRADSRLAPYELVSLSEAISQARTTERFVSLLVSLFGALGLMLAAVGLYGLLSLQVARRQREFGIRSALGATARQLIELVARQGAGLLGIGLCCGGLATWAVARLIRSQWNDMPGPNFIACLGGGIVLLLAAALACWLPARRAGRIDPVSALRAE
jgi:putative ABC transport system permease protein